MSMGVVFVTVARVRPTNPAVSRTAAIVNDISTNVLYERCRLSNPRRRLLLFRSEFIMKPR